MQIEKFKVQLADKSIQLSLCKFLIFETFEEYGVTEISEKRSCMYINDICFSN